MECLERKGLKREIRDRSSRQGRFIRLGKEEFLNFSSNDYLGLASNDRIADASIEALKRYGFGAGASRLLSGGTLLHGELEDMIASFTGTEKAVLFNSGYAANTGVIPVLAGENDALFSDELNHASIVDGCRLSKAERHVYGHVDISDLKAKLSRSAASRKVVITDTVFSMDGDLAPLHEIFDLCVKEGAILYVDDAHGIGVLGKGKGALKHFGLERDDVIIQMATLSKAIGTYGAFIAADSDTINYISSRARSLLYSTAFPPMIAAAAQASLDLIRSGSWRITKLWENIRILHEGMESIGVHTGLSTTQIVPLICEDIEAAGMLSKHLLSRNIYAPVIKPPTVKEPRVRISVTAMHDTEDIHLLLKALDEYAFGK